jgi:predicted nucleic acid-binding protein
MTDSPPRIYWDACVLLSYVDDDADRVTEIDELLRRARAGHIEIVTSIVSQVEVAFSRNEKEDQTLDDEVESRINELWTPNSPIKPVEFHEVIAGTARSLMREGVQHGWRLKSHDAIHLGTAKLMGATDFHTYETGLQKYAELVGCPVRPPWNPMSPLPGTAGK